MATSNGDAVNMSTAINDAYNAANHEGPDPASSRVTNFISVIWLMFSVVRTAIILGTIKIARAIIFPFAYVERRLRYRNPRTWRHVAPRRSASMAQAIEGTGNHEHEHEQRPRRLPYLCLLSDYTLAFTYNDYCGFCGSAMRNEWSLPAEVQGVVLTSCPLSWGEHMSRTARLSLIAWELFTLVAFSVLTSLYTASLKAEEEDAEGWLAPALFTLIGYWITFWQPRLGLLTWPGTIGRAFSMLGIIYIGTTLVANWGSWFVIFMLSVRLVKPI